MIHARQVFGNAPVRRVALFHVLALLITFGLPAPHPACAAEPAQASRWWRGCLHTHSMWSDGDVFPENAIDWYKNHGYHFLALTDHNKFQEGAKWLPVLSTTPTKLHGKRGVATPEAMAAYRALFGPQWVDEVTSAGKQMVRLKTLAEIRPRFEQHGRFLLLPAEEITARVHLNAFNLASTILPPKVPAGQSDPNVWLAQAMTDLVTAQSRTIGRPMLVQLNHPGWDSGPLTVDEVSRIDCLNMMEINNDAAGTSASLPATERMWDTVLARRLAQRRPPMLVTAGDDTHEYLPGSDHPDGGPAHGWVMVRARALTVENLLQALEAGDFYATSGVTLRDIRFDGRQLALEIVPQPGVRFTTEFIGTRKDGRPGEVFAASQELSPVYKLKGDELYVRARVTSGKVRPVRGGDPVCEMAWTQPCCPGSGHE